MTRPSPSTTLGFPLLVPGQVARKADPSDARDSNRLLVFGTLFPRTMMSRADISRHTGLSRMAVSQITQELIDEQFIREAGQQRASGRGRRGTLLSIDSDRHCVIAIDLSQPYLIKGAVMSLKAQSLDHMEIALDDTTELDPGIVTEFCRALLAKAKVPVLGVGISVPGIVETGGRVLNASNLGWTDLDLGQMMSQELGVSVRLDNDANCALTAERCFGERFSSGFFVQITRGVGAATIIDDAVVLGSNMAAGEIGHVCVKSDGPQCVCGKRGCLETMISVNALRRRINDNGSQRSEILAEAGAYLGDALSVPVSLLDIHDVSVYGPPELVSPAFLEAAERTLNANTALDHAAESRVRRCQCGDDIALLGETIAVVYDAIKR